MEIPLALPQEGHLPPIAPAAPRVEPRAPQDTPRYSTFTQLYSDEHRDPCRRNYARIMARFDASLPEDVPAAT